MMKKINIRLAILIIAIFLLSITLIGSIAKSQVYLGVEQQGENIKPTVINYSKNIDVKDLGYLYQFQGTMDNYFGNYRMAIVMDKETLKSYIVIFNDRAISIVQRN